MSRYQKISGFVIKRINYSEADKIITIFSNEEGKNTYLAKGIRKIKSRRAGSLELFNHVKFMYHQGKGMGIITEVDLIESFQSIASDPYKTNIAYQIVELIDKLTKDEQDHEDIYELLTNALPYIKNTDIDKIKYEQILIRFKTRILQLLGFGTPKVTSNEALTRHIEEIIEKELIVGKNFNL